MEEGIKKVQKARAGLVLDQPFFGSLALRVELKEDPTCETCWIDGKTLGFNPKFVDETPLDQLKGVLAHEVLHCAVDHQNRRGARDHKKWNVAGDYAINPLLQEAGFALPPDGLVNTHYAGKSAEEIFNLIPDPPKCGDGGNGNQQQQGGAGGAGGAGGGQKAKPQPGGGQQQHSQSTPTPGQKPAEGGSAANPPNPSPGGQNGQQGQNNPQPSPEHGDPGRCGEVRDAPNGSDASATESSESWRVALSQAAQQAKAMGKLHGGLARLVQETLDPKVDWRKVLRDFMDRSAKNDYNWSQPNKRYASLGVYLPSMISDDMPEVVVAVDTSGSISQRILDQFSAELSEILDQFDTTAHVVYCDTSIHKVEVFEKSDLPIQMKPVGGGGTDFRPVFKWVESEGLTPRCLVFCTDLWGAFPEEQPGYPVLWARFASNVAEVPFGEIIEID